MFWQTKRFRYSEGPLPIRNISAFGENCDKMNSHAIALGKTSILEMEQVN